MYNIAQLNEENFGKINRVFKVEKKFLTNTNYFRDDLTQDKYDMVIFDSIVSNYLAGNKYMSIGMIYRGIVGNEKSSINKETKETLLKRIKELSRIQLNIGWRTFDENRKVVSREDRSMKFLDLSFLEAEFRGHETEWIKVERLPELFEFMDEKGNTYSREFSDFEISRKRVTKTISVLQRELFLFLENEKAEGFSSINLTAESVYKAVGFEYDFDNVNRSNVQKKRIRDAFECVLSGFESSGMISSFKPVKKSGFVENYYIKYY